MSDETATKNPAPKRTLGNIFFFGFIILVFIGVVAAVSSYDETQALSHCGISYAITPAASPSLSFVTFWIDSDQGRIQGPGVVGEHPRVEVTTDTDGAPSVVVNDDHTMILSFKAVMGSGQPSKAIGFDIKYQQPGG